MLNGDEMNKPMGSASNAATLKRELKWFSKVLEVRINIYFRQGGDIGDIREIPPPDLGGDESSYADIIREFEMDFSERIALVLALIPHIRPQTLDTFFTANQNLNRGFTEFGGWKGETHGGFLPTGETAVFILAGDDLERRFKVLRMFDPDHYFTSKRILAIENPGKGEPLLSGALRISTEYLKLLTTGVSQKPDYSMHFPAKLITSKLGWKDLILGADALDAVNHIITWYRHSDTIMNDWGLDKVLKPGYRSLFFGPPGTGKTLTATLIGAEVGADVYRIDLSMIVSKYIGETEKNLAAVFDQAQDKKWILFFDEADALFGRRTTTTNSNDRHANQEISYLLQRVEDFPGVVVLATNLKANIDDAFSRRFQSLVFFPMPDSEQRLRLWQSILAGNCSLAGDVELGSLAENYELSGGAITNVVRFASIAAMEKKRKIIQQADLMDGIRREMRKDGKAV